jgi:hypothetical protein
MYNELKIIDFSLQNVNLYSICILILSIKRPCRQQGSMRLYTKKGKKAIHKVDQNAVKVTLLADALEEYYKADAQQHIENIGNEETEWKHKSQELAKMFQEIDQVVIPVQEDKENGNENFNSPMRPTITINKASQKSTSQRNRKRTRATNKL